MQDDSQVNPRCPRIAFTDDEVRGFYKPWSKALVVKVMEGSFAFNTMKRRLEGLWARAGTIQVSDIANKFFLVRFSDPEDYQRAMLGGPWKIYDYYISVARWNPSFNEEEPIKFILTWVRLPKLPIHYFNRTAVTRIGNAIGKTVRIDLATTEGARARFARVCVEVDLSKPLLGKYMIEDRVLHVEYESLENLCVSCGVYGHKVVNCPTLNPAPQAATDVGKEDSGTDDSKIDGDTGDWMIVGRRKKKINSQGMNPRPQQVSSGSRFDILSTEDKSEFRSSAEHREADPNIKPGNAGSAHSDPYDMAAAAFFLEMQKANEPANQQKKLTKVKGAVSTLRQPLGDISNDDMRSVMTPNTGSANKKGKVVKKDKPAEHSKLVSIPATIHSPIFQTTVVTQPLGDSHPPPRSKARTTKIKAPPPPKKAKEQVRRFAVKDTTLPAQQETQPNTKLMNQDLPMDTDKPPDQRC
ncbi:hypothetical protein LINPERHAP2_LOCUS16135 [Linum perenne]